MRSLLVLVSCLTSCLLWAPGVAGQSNILMLLADDVGVDTVNAYGEHPVPANTPNIDALAARGVLFRNAYANPSCSPTRATILSGRYAWRTGIGTVFSPGPAIEVMQLSGFTTLPDALAVAGYSTALVGKWHLGSSLQHPLDAGFDQVSGSLNSIGNYYQYWKNVNGVSQLTAAYATTDTVDDALALMETLPEPWFIWVAFNAAHKPYHAPPQELHSVRLPKTIAGNEPSYSRAIIEAMDTEIGRLLDSVDHSATTILFVGDNGPEGEAVLPPWTADHAKTTCYEQGVRVPLIVVGPGVVVGGECSALVNTTDLYRTITQLAGAPGNTALDSVSIAPYFRNPSLTSLRPFAFTEYFQPNFAPAQGIPAAFARRAQSVRGKRYKLIHTYEQPSPVPIRREMFDLIDDPLETVNLLESALGPELDATYTALQVQLQKNAPSPWVGIPAGVPGVLGFPNLMGAGSLVPGTNTTVELNRAAPLASGALVVGWSVQNSPFLCGVMVPSIDSLVFFQTGQSGGLLSSFAWPVLPPLTQVTLQAWVQDEVAACGYSASNGLTATSAP